MSSVFLQTQWLGGLPCLFLPFLQCGASSSPPCRVEEPLMTHEGAEREGRTRKHKVGVGRAEKNLWVKDSAQAQSKGLSSFLLDLSSWVPNSWTFTYTSGYQTGGLGNKEGGKHHRGWSLHFSWSFVMSSSRAFREREWDQGGDNMEMATQIPSQDPQTLPD